jgi:hypothetical protein
VTGDIETQLQTVRVKTPRPITGFGAFEVMPFDTDAALAVAPVETLPTAAEGFPDLGFGEIATRWIPGQPDPITGAGKTQLTETGDLAIA